MYVVFIKYIKKCFWPSMLCAIFEECWIEGSLSEFNYNIEPYNKRRYIKAGKNECAISHYFNRKNEMLNLYLI